VSRPSVAAALSICDLSRVHGVSTEHDAAEYGVQPEIAIEELGERHVRFEIGW
jgi:hypothetical protein